MSLPQPPSPADSRWIWPFEILEQIGEGGMGVVYRARYVVNNRLVALKMVPTDVTDKMVLARFERELEILKTLQHPNIVRCFGGVCEDKRRFYAMELVEGGSLDDELQKKGKLLWEQVVEYGLQMCAALECLHQRGVVHRDVKPSNFLKTPDGQLKLGDFGLASVMAARKITTAGKTAGTFLYMAPEQIRGQDVTPQTDLYALGCVLYELVTGKVPFLGETAGATLHLHCHAAPKRPTEYALDCPLALERIILKLLEKNPADRPASAVAVMNELRSVGQPTIVGAAISEFYSDRVHPEKLSPGFPSDAGTATSPMSARRPNLAFAAAVLAMVLACSLIWNVIQLFDASRQSLWREKWLAAADSPNVELRIAAVDALGTKGSGPVGLEMLKNRLEDSDARVRLATIGGLKEVGEPARQAIPALVRLYKNDPDPRVRDAAKEAFETLRSMEGTSHFPWIFLGLMLMLMIGAGVVVYVWFRSPAAHAPRGAQGAP